MQVMIQAPKLACDISIVIKSIPSDWSIENPRWRPFSKMAAIFQDGHEQIHFTLSSRTKVAEFVNFFVETNILKMLESPLNVPHRRTGRGGRGGSCPPNSGSLWT